MLSQDAAIVSEKFTGRHSSGIASKNVTVFFPFLRLRFMKYSEFAGRRVCPLDFSLCIRYAKSTI